MRCENETITLENGMCKDITWKILDDGTKEEVCSVTYSVEQETTKDEYTVESVLKRIAETILSNKPTAEKQGYKLELKYACDTGSATWEYVVDENYTPSHSGDYIDPIPYVEGMTVMTGNFYTDGNDIWEALKNGTPMDFTDREYFDIIG